MEHLPTIISVYLIVINIVTAIIFAGDKKKAKNRKMRIPEKTLHLLEFAGGFVAVLILMYTIRHKNRKTKYYIWTYLACLIWIVILIWAL